jgi:hypothetical protein
MATPCQTPMASGIRLFELGPKRWSVAAETGGARTKEAERNPRHQILKEGTKPLTPWVAIVSKFRIAEITSL